VNLAGASNLAPVVCANVRFRTIRLDSGFDLSIRKRESKITDARRAIRTAFGKAGGNPRIRVDDAERSRAQVCIKAMRIMPASRLQIL